MRAKGKDWDDDGRSKRQKLLDAAYVIFSQKGYHCATVDEIVALANTGKGTVYNYFANKDHLFYTLIDERSAPFLAALNKVAESDDDPLSKLEQMIRLHLRFFAENHELWRVMMHEMRGFGSLNLTHISPEEQEKYRRKFHENINILQQVLEEGIARGVITYPDTARAAHAIFTTILVTVFHRLGVHDIEPAVRSITRLFFYGITR